jgi:hypothetical protein
VSNVLPSVYNQNSKIEVDMSNNFVFNSIGVPEEVGMPDTQDYQIGANFSQTIPNIEITIAIDLNEEEFLVDFKDQLKKFIRAVSASDTGGKISFNILPFGGDVNLSPDMISRFNTVNPTSFSAEGHRSCLVLPNETKDKIAINMGGTYSWSWPVYFDRNYNENFVTNETRPYFEYAATAFFSVSSLNDLQKPSLQRPAYFTSPNIMPWGVCRYMTKANNPAIGIQPTRVGGVPSFDAINSYIDGLVANRYNVFAQSNNAIAMKWALALMDPSTRQLFSPQPNNGMSSSKVQGRPIDYGTQDSYKILIFASNSLFYMSNGSLTSGPNGLTEKTFASMVREIKPEFLDGTMPAPDIWRTPPSNNPNRNIRYSIRHPEKGGGEQYWVIEGGQPGDCYDLCDVNDKDSPNYDPELSPKTVKTEGHWASQPFSYPGEGQAQQQSWRQIFESMSVDYLIERLYMRPMSKIGVLPGDSNFHYASLADRFTYIATNNSLLRHNFGKLCKEAKSKGVTIYTLLGDGVMNVSSTAANADIRNANAPGARTELQSCASTGGHSFMANITSQLKSAMLTIAISITQLSAQETAN